MSDYKSPSRFQVSRILPDRLARKADIAVTGSLRPGYRLPVLVITRWAGCNNWYFAASNVVRNINQENLVPVVPDSRFRVAQRSQRSRFLPR